MKIAIKDLKILCDKILAKAEKSGLEEINIDIDYYWSVSSQDAYNFSKTDATLMVGSFQDDWNNLQKLLDTSNQPTNSRY